MNTLTVSGKIYKTFETQQVTDTFQKREFVLDYAENPMYPQKVKFELVQDRCDYLNKFKEGDFVEVSFNLKGREWNSPQNEVKFFNSIEAWRIAPATSQEQPQAATPQPVAQTAEANPKDDSDDLPF